MIKTEIKSLLKTYSRAIVHMKDQIELSRFGLIFGAGISKDLGFPKWDELISKIAKHKDINDEDLLKKSKSNTSLSQLLFQTYKLNYCKDHPYENDNSDKVKSHILSGWLQIIHDALYEKVSLDIKELMNMDCYLKDFLDIIRKTKLTINYNFDNTIQLFLSETRTEEKKQEERGYRTVWDTDLQLYPRNAVIYHPNGFIPRNFRERPSDGIIFLEDSFGDQLIDSLSGHYKTLSYHLTQNTCLFIGVSLDDSTLKHILHHNSKLYPGHVHYYIYFLEKDERLTQNQMMAIRDANFEVYNLVTLFLTRAEISTLGKILSSDMENIEMWADEIGINLVYRYFFTGSVCVGKSTSVSHFRSLRTHDEWLEQKVEGMEKEPEKLNDKEKIKSIDNWVVHQWRKKNFILSKALFGLHIIDRAPLDALAFTPVNEWVEKAKFTLDNIAPNKSEMKLCKGKIIFLIGDPEVIAIRAIKLKKDVTVEKLNYRQELLKIIYDNREKGIVLVDTHNKSIKQVVKEICKIIHLEDYEECDLDTRLRDIYTEKITSKVTK